MEETNCAEITGRITISSYGLDGAEIQDGDDGDMILVCGNGQRFRIRVTEMGPALDSPDDL